MSLHPIVAAVTQRIRVRSASTRSAYLERMNAARQAGTVRSRCFSLADGVGEDEATGSAAIVLAAELNRELTIHQGEGSRLYARPLGDGRAEVGGRVVLDEVR